MGCCTGIYRTININKEISINPENFEKSESYNNSKNPILDSQNHIKSDKEIVKKESTNENLKKHKINKIENKKDKHNERNISPKTNIENEENKPKVNKNKVIKKGSQRVQRAMKELKILSMKELDNNKKYFTQII